MEKAILKTLIYADIFDYPLKADEIHKWLIRKRASLKQVEKALGRLIKKKKVEAQKGFYFLSGRDILVRIRQIREKQSNKFLLKAKFATWFLQVIPWIKLIGVSGGLAMKNADKKDDIDLFLVTSKNRLWLSRLLTIILLDLLGVRRKVSHPQQIAGKLCLNILLEEDRLGQSKGNIYLVHEVLQMKVLWHRDGIYQKYLEDNQWAFEFLPNWTTSPLSQRRRGFNNLSVKWIPIFAGTATENLAKKFQLWYMSKPQGMERIEDGALYFHPNDIRPQVLKEYRMRLKKL